ncbi:MAG TPA: hypothetical protein VGL42_17555 [Opitutaceae bacterium]|jgi:hypothetical protein
MHPQNLENVVWLVLAAAGGIAQMVRKAMAARKKADGTPKRDPDQDERTRRVREEVARKIAQRRSPPPRLPPPAAPPGWKLPTASLPRRQPSPIPELEELVQPEFAPASAFASFPGSDGDAASTSVAVPAMSPILGAPVTSRRLELFDDLRSPATTRRAVLLREIIGPPVALRRGGL